MFDTDRSSFFPCILHIMMICGKLTLSLTRKVALALPNDRVRLLKATLKAANIRWRGSHKENLHHMARKSSVCFALEIQWHTC